ncbi:hypothetical protein DHEL01_v203002 [Diaporthe helianthi]|uniref:Uncharacterized protein n=1 Tax=Diaporthe helianthi TaxID=158607 RepID=A0A2P5I7V8_DIAHE|nr:hypothetical protein DHEL01_v203002 [Diaporthe helianthi]
MRYVTGATWDDDFIRTYTTVLTAVMVIIMLKRNTAAGEAAREHLGNNKTQLLRVRLKFKVLPAYYSISIIVEQGKLDAGTGTLHSDGLI